MCNSFDIVRQQKKVVAVFLLDFSLGSLQLYITWLIVALGTITYLHSSQFHGLCSIQTWVA